MAVECTCRIIGKLIEVAKCKLGISLKQHFEWIGAI